MLVLFRWCLFPPDTPKELLKPTQGQAWKQKGEAITWFSFIYPKCASPEWPEKYKMVSNVVLCAMLNSFLSCPMSSLSTFPWLLPLFLTSENLHIVVLCMLAYVTIIANSCCCFDGAWCDSVHLYKAWFTIAAKLHDFGSCSELQQFRKYYKINLKCLSMI